MNIREKANELSNKLCESLITIDTSERFLRYLEAEGADLVIAVEEKTLKLTALKESQRKTLTETLVKMLKLNIAESETFLASVVNPAPVEEATVSSVLAPTIEVEELAEPPTEKAEKSKVVLITDSELRRLYFKDGRTVKSIAEETGIDKIVLYKRVQKMKEELAEKQKELVRRA